MPGDQCIPALDKKKGQNIPSRIIVSNRSEPRLIEIKKLINEINPEVPAEYHLAREHEVNDRILESKRIFAYCQCNGLGKDRRVRL